MEHPGVAVSVTIGETPLQPVRRQRVHMEFVFVIDAAAVGVDNLLRQCEFLIALHHFHPEVVFHAREIQILAIQSPLAGADIVETHVTVSPLESVTTYTCRAESRALPSG